MPNIYDDLTATKLDALLSSKLEKLAVKGQEKLERVDPAVAEAKAYWDAYDARINQQLADSPRAYHELVQDFPTSMARTTTNLVGGTAALALELSDNAGVGGFINDRIDAGDFGADVRDQRQKIRDMTLGAVRRGTSRVDELLAERMSKVSKINSALVAQENAADQAAHAAEYEAALAAGDNTLLAGGKRLAQDLASGVANTASNPTELSNLVVGQVPTLGIGVGAKAAVTADAVAARAALLAEARGMAGAQAARFAERSAVKEVAAEQLATRNLMLGVGGTEAGGAYQQGTEQILSAPIELLAEHFPQVQEQLAQGVPENVIREQLASKVGMTAAAIQGPLAALTSRLAAKFELNPTGVGGRATNVGQKVIHAGADAGKEAVEETLQSGSGELATNLGERFAGNDSNDLLEGVGVAAGQGGLAGGVMAGGFKVPGIVAGGTVDAGKLAYAGGKRAVTALVDRGERILQEASAPAREQHAAASEQMQRAAAQVEETAAATLAPEQVAPIATAEDPMVSPELAQAIGATDPANPVGKTTALARTLSLLTDPTNPLGAKKAEANLYALKTARQLNRWLNDLGDAMDAAPEGPAKEAFAALGNQIADLIESETVQGLEAEAAKADPNVLEPYLEAVRNAPEGGEISPELKQAFALIQEASYAQPDVVRPVIDKLLMQQDLDPEERAHLESVRDIGAAVDSHQATKAELPKVTSPDITSQGIRETGFKGLPSLREFGARISRAMGSGNLPQAKFQLQKLHEFVQHLDTKARVFDQTAVQAVEDDTFGEAHTIPGYKTLDKDGNSTSKDFVLRPSNENSAAVIDHIFNDAHAAAATYNALAKAYPEMVRNAGLPAVIAGPAAKPTYKAMASAEAARGARLQRAYDQHLEDRQHMVLTEGKDGRPELIPYGPMRKRETVAKVYDPGGKQLSKKQVENVLAGRMPTEYKASKNAVEEVAAPVAEATPKVAAAPAEEAAPAPEERTEADPARDHAVAKEQAKEAVRQAVSQEASEQDLLTQGRELMGDTQAVVDFGTEERASADEMNQALNMSEAEYLASVNPEGKVTPETPDQVIDAELDDMEPSSRATEVGRVGDTTLMADGDYLYAVQGEEVVGLLIHKEDGTTFTVRSSQRGKGIGKAMMRELLVRKPLALSGGLSESAKQTRLAVLRDLRAERMAANAPKTVEARYPGPLESTVEITPDTDTTTKLKARNRLFTAFQLNAKSRSLFARMSSPVATVTEALRTAFREKNPALLKDLFVKEHAQTTLDTEQVQALRAVFEKFLPELVAQLNQNLYEAATNTGYTMRGIDRVTGKDANGEQVQKPGKAGGWLEELIDNPARSHKWQYLDNTSLHGAVWGRTENGEPYIHYQQEVAEAMALAGLHWVLNNINSPIPFDAEKIGKMFEDGIIPPHLEESFQKGLYYKGPVRALGNDIIRLMGLQPKSDAPVTHTDAMGKALAADAFRALVNLGVLQLDEQEGTETTKKGGTAKMYFIRFNKDEEPNNWADQTAVRSIQLTRNALGTVAPLTRMLFPDSEELVRIGTPGTEIPTKVAGTGHPMSEKQRKQVAISNQTAHYINTPFKELLGKLGRDNFLRLRGYYFGELDELNKMDRRNVEGVNLGLAYQIAGINEIDDLLTEHANANNLDPKDVPLYWNYRVTSNGRLMQNGFGPQGYKVAREMFTPNRAVLDLGNKSHEKEFLLAVAQALGIKTEKQSNAASVKEVSALLRTKPFAKVLDLMVAPDSGPELTDALEELGKTTKEVLSERGLNALLNAALFREAKRNKDKTFTTYLAFELDGKTDGPINAMVHFGLHGWSNRVLEQLRQGGLFVGDISRPTLNDWGKKLGDLYQNVSRKVEADIVNARKDPKRSARNKRILELAIDQMAELGHMTVTDPQDRVIEVARSFSKHGMVSSVYGSGAKAVIAAITKETVDHIYKQLSQAINENKPLPKETQARLEILMGEMLQRDPGGGQPKVIKITMPDLSDVSSYKSLQFSVWNIRALQQNLTMTVGGLMTDAIHEELAPIRETFTTLYRASALQTAAFQKAYTKAYDARRKELVAKGELLEKDALSRDDEQQIVASLKHLLPTYQTPLTAGEESDRGITASLKDYDGEFVLEDGSQEKPESIAGGLPTEINRFGLQPPGVRAAALYTIGLGDATMMGLMFDRVLEMLNVFDGLEVSVGAIKDAAKKVNEATIQGWKFNALGSVRDSFSKIQLDPNEFSMEELKALIGNDLTEEEWENLPIESIRKYLTGMVESTKDALEGVSADVAAVKQVIFNEVAHASDHMSGGENPATGNADQTVDGDVAAHVLARAAEIRNNSPATQAVTGAAVAEESNSLSARVFPESADGAVQVPALRTYDRAGLEALLKNFPFHNRVQEFVYLQLRNLIPADIQVHFGTPAQIAAKVAEVVPGVQGVWNGKGAFYGNHVFVANTSTETLVHELVHATTFALIRRYYTDGAKGLSDTQRAAAAQLERLTRAFLELDLHNENQAAQDAAAAARATIQRELAQGDTAAAVNEFMAWTLTNPSLQRLLANKVKPKGVLKLASEVLGWIRQLLRLPNNSVMQSFLESTLGSFRLLTSDTSAPGVVDKLLNQIDEEDATDHAGHVRQVADMFRRVMALPNRPISLPTIADRIDETSKAFINAQEVQDDFVHAGWDFTDEEMTTFGLTQAMFASSAQLDPQLMISLERLHKAVSDQVKPEHFLADPDNATQAEFDEAHRKHTILFGVGALRTDKFGRSNLLANFVALGLVNQEFRQVLGRLTLPKAADPEKTVDGQLRHWATVAFDKLGDAALRVSPDASTRAVLDQLTQRLLGAQEDAVKRAQAEPNALMRAEAKVREKLEGLGELAARTAEKRQAKGKDAGVDAWVNSILGGLAGLTSKTRAEAFAEGHLRMLNESNLWTPLRELGTEAIGITGSNRPVAQLLNKAKHAVARARQRLRDEVPGQIRGMFSQELPAKTWEILHRGVAKADLQALLSAYDLPRIQELIEDPAELADEIARLEGGLGEHTALYAQEARHLATYLMTGYNDSIHLSRNAAALAWLVGRRDVQLGAEPTPELEAALDRLVTLRAVEQLSTTERMTIGELMGAEKQAMEQLLNIMRAQVRSEQMKPGAEEQRFNTWKGFVPESRDPRKQLVLANAKRGEELLKLGYTKLGDYYGDPSEIGANQLAYYVTTAGGPTTYNQGAMQTVEGTVGGVDRFTGRTLHAGVKTQITYDRTVEVLAGRKFAWRKPTRMNLLPLHNAEGQIVGYERVVDPALLEKYTNGRKDLADSIGMWLGRNTEEAIARKVNQDLADVLKAKWDEEKADQPNAYVDITTAKGAIAGAWEAAPREMKDLLRNTFGDGPIMVRKDMVNNALGYRSISVGDVFMQVGMLPEQTRKTIMNVAAALLGKDAYKYLVIGERAWQGLVYTAKDAIVVRSGVVGVANILANQLQLLSMGVPLKRLLQMQLGAVREVEAYLRNEKRLAQITIEQAATSDANVLRALAREEQSLHDANARLSIMPLIRAGELPSIAEGLNEQDQYTLMTDATSWIKSRVDKLPKGLSTAARYAVISKDTALYQGLNRMIQFGDFMAKAALYQQRLQEGKSEQETLNEVNESFVNYNLLPGQTRDYLESMGLTWFLNYKIRIQKIIARTIRQNPLRMILDTGTGYALGVDTLLGSSAPVANLDYALGPDPLFNSPDMLMWNQF